MSPKQQRFVDEWLVDMNATAAYKRAGYTAKGNAAEVNAARLLRNAQVKAAIKAAQKEQQQRTQLTADWVIEQLVINAKRAMKSSVKAGGTVANKALELLGRHLGMFRDQLPLTPDGKAVQVRVVEVVSPEGRKP